MKQLFILQLIISFSYLSLDAQTDDKVNKPIAEIFSDFHINLNDTSKTSGFGVNRAYLGYNFAADNNFSARLILNLGNPDDFTGENVKRRYAYFREAAVTWSNERLRMAFGLTDTRIFKYQQKWWGKRYLASSYQSLNGYGYVADLGLAIDYKFNEVISGDFTVMNGDGYLELQLDNGVKSSLGITITPNSNFAFRLYGDYEQKPGLDEITGIIFAGYRNKLINIGVEASIKTNLDAIQGDNAWGLSATGGINFTEKDELFVRYDYSKSVVLEGSTIPWNYKMDGTFSIFGLQHSFSTNIKLALDFQSRNPDDSSSITSNLIFLNALFRF